jgi:hypothetical protein
LTLVLEVSTAAAAESLLPLRAGRKPVSLFMASRQSYQESTRTHQHSSAEQSQLYQANSDEQGNPGQGKSQSNRGADGDSNGRAGNHESLS